MPQLVDCYFLIESREKRKIELFLERFIPDREELAADYPIPYLSDSPTAIIHSIEELIEFLASDSTSEYAIYWQNRIVESKLQNGMLFYTNDACLILGISLKAISKQDVEVMRICNEVKSFLQCQYACITVEEPPPLNSEEFIEFAKHRYSI